jgi:hypothetical protein
MSRILRRPLFRGGPVSSYGTGIASGLADGGRVGYKKGRLVTGADLMKGASQAQNLYGNLYPPKGPRGMGQSTGVNTIWSELYGGSNFEEGDKPDLSMNYTIPDTTVSEDLIDTSIVNTSTGSDAEENQPTVADEQIKGVEVNEGEQTIDTNTGKVIDTEESYEINADDVREQAALFDKLLNEDYEKDLKSARISDASDYALKFFESTVGQGKGIKESAGDVAGFALAKPSKTEGVKEGKKKTKQTATVMAINEALASNKSDRELDKMFAKMGLDEAMRTRLLNKRITLELEAGKGTTITKRISADKTGESDLKKLRKHTKAWAEDQEVPLGSVTSIITKQTTGSDLPLVTDLQSLLVEENKNAVFIDETSKKSYQVVEDANGNLKLKQIG